MSPFVQQLLLKLLFIPTSALVQFAFAYLLPVRSWRRPLSPRVAVAAGGFAAGALCSAGMVDLFSACNADFDAALLRTRGKNGSSLLLGDFSVSNFLLLCGFMAALAIDQLVFLRLRRQVPDSSATSSHEELLNDGSELERMPIIAEIVTSPTTAAEASAPNWDRGNAETSADCDSGSSGGSACRYGTNGNSNSASGAAAAGDSEGELLEEVQLDQPTDPNATADDCTSHDYDDAQAASAASIERIVNHRRGAFLTGILCCCLCVHSAAAGWRVGADWMTSPVGLSGLFLRLPLHQAAVAMSAGLQFSADGCSSSRFVNPRLAIFVACCLAVSLAEPLGIAIGMLMGGVVVGQHWMLMFRAVLLSVNAGAFLFVVLLHALPSRFADCDGSLTVNVTSRAGRASMVCFFLLGCCSIVLGSFVRLLF